MCRRALLFPETLTLGPSAAAALHFALRGLHSAPAGQANTLRHGAPRAVEETCTRDAVYSAQCVHYVQPSVRI